MKNAFGRSLKDSDRVLDFIFFIGDANHDGYCNFTDLVIHSQHYNTSTQNPDAPYAEGDFNMDGSVNFADLVLLSQHYNMDVWD